MLLTNRSQNLLTLLAAGWMFLLLLGAIQPEWLMLAIVPDKHLFGPVHTIAYGLFSLILCFYFRRFKSLGPLRLHTLHLTLVVFLAAGLCGGLAECLQLFSVERIADWADVRANLLGSAIGILGFFAVRALSKVRTQQTLSPLPSGERVRVRGAI